MSKKTGLICLSATGERILGKSLRDIIARAGYTGIEDIKTSRLHDGELHGCSAAPGRTLRAADLPMSVAFQYDGCGAGRSTEESDSTEKCVHRHCVHDRVCTVRGEQYWKTCPYKKMSECSIWKEVEEE